MTAPRRTSRRDFLQGKSAAVALSDLAQGLVEDTPQDAALSPPTADGQFVRFSHRAMACEFEVLLNAGQYDRGAEAALEAMELIDRLEDQLTVFRDTSEVSRLNQRAAREPVAVEARLFGLLELAARLHRETGGAFDVTAGPLTKAWGFYRREGRLPGPDELTAARSRVGMQHVELDSSARQVRFLSAGVEINLGSIGKGYALDRVAELLTAAGVHDFLLHGGNSSMLARGTMSGAARGGWPIGLPNPLDLSERLGEIDLHDQSLATSGSGTQFFEHEGRRYGHILDPRTGWPAAGVLTATVIAPTAAEADALSTAMYVFGPDGAAEFCRAHPQIGVILVCPTRDGDVDVKSFGLAGQGSAWNGRSTD